MNSDVLAYGETARAVDVTHVADADDRGKDLPLAVVFFAPVLAAYAAIGYALYLVVSPLI